MKKEIEKILGNTFSQKESVEKINKLLKDKYLLFIDDVTSMLDRRCDSYSRIANYMAEKRKDVLS